MLSFICVSTSTFTQQSQTDALLWFTTDSQGQGVIYSSQNQVHTLIKILGYHLGSFTSHYVGDIDKQQCRFTDWSYIQRQHHNEISTLTWLGFWSIMTLMKPWSPALSFLLISCVCWRFLCRFKNRKPLPVVFSLDPGFKTTCLLQQNIQGHSLQAASIILCFVTQLWVYSCWISGENTL